MNKQSTPALIRQSRGITMLAATLLTVSCKEIPKEVEITQQRELCKFDENEALRGDINRLRAKQPLNWRRTAGTKHRQLNYFAGDKTQIAVGLFTGSVEDNVIRWFAEYGIKKESFDVSTLEQGSMLGTAKYYIVEVTGNFAGMQKTSNLDNWSTIGIICEAASGELITIKMTGPVSETAKEKQNLIKFAEDLQILTFPEDKR